MALISQRLPYLAMRISTCGEHFKILAFVIGFGRHVSELVHAGVVTSDACAVDTVAQRPTSHVRVFGFPLLKYIL